MLSARTAQGYSLYLLHADDPPVIKIIPRGAGADHTLDQTIHMRVYESYQFWNTATAQPGSRAVEAERLAAHASAHAGNDKACPRRVWSRSEEWWRVT